jgi:hypothetical protein
MLTALRRRFYMPMLVKQGHSLPIAHLVRKGFGQEKKLPREVSKLLVLVPVGL